jgi:hypothetical protein
MASLLWVLCVCPLWAQDPSPTVRSDGIYCREEADRDWQVRITGEVTSPAGLYVAVTDVEGKVIARGGVPRGAYPPEKPFRIKVPRDGKTGDYLLSIFGTQRDFGGIFTPYTDLPREVYGKTFFHVIRQGAARSRAYTEAAPGGLYFQMSPGVEELTFTQDGVAWRIHSLDGSVIYDVSKDGQTQVNPANKRTTLTGVFKGEAGKTYILGHEFFWFYARPQLFLAVAPQRWFVPDERLRLDPTWWRQNP